MKVTYNYLTARGLAKSRLEAMDQCALKILKESGPWLDSGLIDKTNENIASLLPASLSSWCPPKYNLKHVRLEQK
jgi:hypothetical protein